MKFSGKELDDITGLYDHGARNRNPISTLWYGIDPLFEKYPDFSPYNYCAGNPVILVDPDGRDWLLSTGSKLYWYKGDYGDKSKGVEHEYNICSGLKVNEQENYQFRKYQGERLKGPTPEGHYFLNLRFKGTSEKDGINQETGHPWAPVVLNGKGGMVTVPNQDPQSIEDINTMFVNEWGQHRIKLNPVDGEVLETGRTNFYFHDSEKGYTHGCTEVPLAFFVDLETYIQDTADSGLERLEVKIEYDDIHQTNGTEN